MELAGSNTLFTSVTGAIVITGQGGPGAGLLNSGVLIDSGVHLTATGNTSINITGTGGQNSSENTGVGISSSTTVVSSAGTVQITGSAGGTGAFDDNIGVEINTAQVTATGTVTITGTGGSGTQSDLGVALLGAGTLVQSASAIVITGTAGGGAGSTGNEVGVALDFAAQVTATGTAPITITGTGGTGTSGNFGVEISDPGTAIASLTGPITINGTAGTGTGTVAVDLVSVVQATSTSGPITFVGDSMLFDTQAAINTASVVTLEPLTPGLQVNLGATNAAGTLGLTNAELLIINAGAYLQIGSAAAGQITISAPISAPAGWLALVLVTGTGVTETGSGSLTVGSLLLKSAGPVQLAQANAVCTLAAATSGPISFSDTTGLMVAPVGGIQGLNSSNGDVTLSVAGNLAVNAPLTAGTGMVDLKITGALTSAGSGAAIQAGGLAIEGGATAVGTASNPVYTILGNSPPTPGIHPGNLAASVGTGGVFLVNTGDLMIGAVLAVTGVVASSGPITITSLGGLYILQPVTTASSAAVTLTGNGVILVNMPITGKSATVLGSSGADSITVTVTGTTTLRVAGQGGGDTYVVNFGQLVAPVVIDSSGAGGTNTVTVEGPNSADSFVVTRSDVSDAHHQEMTYTGIQQLTVMGRIGGNTTVVQSTSSGVPVVVDTGPGNNTISVGDSNNTMTALASQVDVIGQGGTNALIVNDQGTSVLQTYVVTSTYVQRDPSLLGGLVSVAYTQMASLVLSGGPDGNTFFVQGTASGTPITINDGAGSDWVHVGDAANTLNGIASLLTINCQGGSDILTINDQGTTTPQSYTVSGTAVERTGRQVQVDYDPLAILTLNGGFGGVGGNTIGIQGTAAGTTTTVNDGGGNDTVNVLPGAAVNGPLTLNGQAGNDVFNITPSKNAPIFIDGGDSQSKPGTLNFNAAGAAVNVGYGGSYSALGSQTVTFSDVKAIGIFNTPAVSGFHGPDTADRNQLTGLSSAQRFVQALYLDALGRAGSLAELNA